MHAGIAHVAFEHLGIFHRIGQELVARVASIFQLLNIFDTVFQIDFLSLAVLLGQAVGNEAGQAVRLGERQFLHPRHILDSQLGGHGTVGDDVGHLLGPILLGYPLQHPSATIVIEVDIDIGQRNTVGVEEALEQQVVLHGVYLGNLQAVGHHRTGGRTTAGAYRHVELGAGGVDKVLHNEEVTRETHRFHDVQLEGDALQHLGRELLAVALVCPLEGELLQIVGLELDTVEFLITAQFLDFLAGRLLVHHHIAVLVAGKLVENILVGKLAAILLLGTEALGNGEGRHKRGVVYRVELDLVENLERIRESLGHIGKEVVHLLLGLQPLLFGIEHAGGVVEILARAQADEAVVRLGILLFDKMDVVGTYQFDAVLARHLDKVGIHLVLQDEGLVVGPRHGGLVALQLQVVVVAENPLEPQDGLLGSRQVARQYFAGNLATQTGRADDEPLVIFLEFVLVGTGTRVETLGPPFRHQLDEVVIPLQILGQHNQVITAIIDGTLADGDAVHLVDHGTAHLARSGLLVGEPTAGHIHLATQDGFEYLGFEVGYLLAQRGQLGLLVVDRFVALLDGIDAFLYLFDVILHRTVFLLHQIEKLFYPEHVAVVGQGQALHAVFHGLVDQRRYGSLSVENRVLGVNVQMNKGLHI